MNNYNFNNYVSNSVIRSVANDLMANPQKTVTFSTCFGGKIWTLTENNNSSKFDPEQSHKFFILKRIWNAVVFLFKSFDSAFQSSFNNAMNSMNQSYRTHQESLEKQLTLVPGEVPAQKRLLPDLIKSKIMPYLDYNSFRAMAAVCRQWKTIIDNEANDFSLLDEKLFSEVVDLQNAELIKFVSLLTNAQKLEILTKFKEEYVNLVDNHKGFVITKLKISQIHLSNNEITLSFSWIFDSLKN